MFSVDSFTIGRHPWNPSDSVVNHEVWIDDHVPLVGTFDFNNQTILYTAVGEPTREHSLWRYCIIPQEETNIVKTVQFPTVFDCQNYVDRIMNSSDYFSARAEQYKII